MKKLYQYPIDTLIFNKSPGVYKITDCTNLCIYIGSSEDLRRRVTDHCRALQRGISLSRRLQESFNKHKLIYNLKFEILEYCPKEKLIEREQYYLDTLLFAQEYIRGENKKFLKLGLNTFPTSNSALGSEKTDDFNLKNSKIQSILQRGDRNGMYGKHHTKETKIKIGLANTGKNKKISGDKHYLFGKHHSNETKNKISVGGTGRVVSIETKRKNSLARKGKKHTKETKEKISNTKLLNPVSMDKIMKKVAELDSNGSTIKIYKSITDVIKQNKISYFIVNKILNNRYTKNKYPNFEYCS